MKTTRTVAGYKLSLDKGVRYWASRPMAQRGMKTFPISIQVMGPNGPSLHAVPVVTIPGLSYDDANAFLAAFNDGESSFSGRVWLSRHISRKDMS